MKIKTQTLWSVFANCMENDIKKLNVKPIPATPANGFVKAHHYSGKVVPNSQLHFGIFWEGSLEGVIQFGPSINKKGTINTVPNTKWNEFIEINRMVFSEKLPRNSESRALAVCLRLIRKNALLLVLSDTSYK